MKKELFICILIFIIIIIANILTQNYTKECVSYIDKELKKRSTYYDSCVNLGKCK